MLHSMSMMRTITVSFGWSERVGSAYSAPALWIQGGAQTVAKRTPSRACGER
jgi:hypothetical protein